MSTAILLNFIFNIIIFSSFTDDESENIFGNNVKLIFCVSEKAQSGLKVCIFMIS